MTMLSVALCRVRLEAWFFASLLAALIAVSVPLGADDSASEILVRYRSADAVYLDAGTAAGLAVGDRLVISRDGETVAEIEVVFVARHSASCRVVAEPGEVLAGDSARRVDAVDTTDATTQQPETEVGEAPVAAPTTGRRREVAPLPESVREPYATTRREMRLSGSVSLDWEGSSGGDRSDFDYTRTGVRLDLRARDIGGRPYELRARMRRYEFNRDRLLDDLPSESETRDRFYELSLTYEPSEGSYSYAVGRLGARSSVLGYLDGALGRISLSRSLDVGGFVGSRPELGEFSVEAAELKYGLFAEYSPPRPDGRRALSLFFAGVREEGEFDISREYLALRTRYAAGRRWSFYQRAEIDLNNGWRREFEQSAAQLSNLSLGATARLSDRSRLSLSFDRYERYRTEDTRFLSRELFDDLLRQGFRARLSFGAPRALNVSLFGGYRERDDDTDATYSYGLSLSDSRITALHLGLTFNLLGFTNEFTEGFVATLRVNKRFRGGHELSLTLGDRLSTDRLFDEETDTGWLRLRGWIELPQNLFATLGYEVTTGDEVDDRLTFASLGYRF